MLEPSNIETPLTDSTCLALGKLTAQLLEGLISTNEFISEMCKHLSRLGEVEQRLVERSSQVYQLKDEISKLNDFNKDVNLKNQMKADLFDYLMWLDLKKRNNDLLKTTEPVCVASDGTNCFAKTYEEAVMIAEQHDREIIDKKS